MINKVGLFFVVNGKILFHGCELDKAQNYGDFKIYDKSHYDVWEKHYYKRYKVDYDYFPRGRITYNKKQKCFWLYKDSCIEEKLLKDWIKEFGYQKIIEKEDEHYKCHSCNRLYIKMDLKL